MIKQVKTCHMNMAGIKTYFLLLIIILTQACVSDPYVNFRVPRKIHVGDTLKMTWEVDEVSKNTNVKIINVSDSLPLYGEKKLLPAASTRYVMHLEDEKGVFKKKYRTVEVILPVIHFFTAEPDTFMGEAGVRFNWETENAKKVFIRGIDQELSHSGMLFLPVDTARQFTLIAKSAFYEERQPVLLQKIENRPYISGIRPAQGLKKDQVVMDIIRTDYSNFPRRVKLKLIASDKQGRFIKNLASSKPEEDYEDFFFKALMENYQGEKKPASFSVREYQDYSQNPYDIVFAMDYSASMVTLVDDMESAVMQFISIKNEDDRVAVVRFDEQIKKDTRLLSNSIALMKKIEFNGIDGFGGASALYAGLDESIKEIAYSRNNKLLVLFTDGQDNASLSYYADNETKAEAIAQKLKKHNIPLVCLAYGTNVNRDVLKKLCHLSGGTYYEIKRKADIKAIINELAFTTRNVYEISYRPSNKKTNRIVEVLYNNNQGKNLTTDYPFLINDTTHLNEIDLELASFSYQNILDSIEGKVVMPPQTVLNFMLDSSTIERHYKANLNNYNHFLKDHPAVQILLAGHSDLSGRESYNQQLSKKRAEQVKEYFKKTGIDSSRISTIGLGSMYPIWPNESKEWMAKENRRVEAIFYDAGQQ